MTTTDPRRSAGPAPKPGWLRRWIDSEPKPRRVWSDVLQSVNGTRPRGRA